MLVPSRSFGPPQAGKREGLHRCPHSAKEELGILLKKIEAMAQDEAFNRVVVALATGSASGLMGLPSGETSSAPEGVAGIAVIL